MFYCFGSCLLLCVLFFSVSWLFRKLKGQEENPITDNNSSSDSNAPQIKYDVFVSFRGEIRDGFLSHLVEAFKRNQISAFVDDRLEKGKDVGPSLVGAIEASSISLIIFSPHYASSCWCLKELVTILKCRDEYGQIVIPVFYKVEPTDVGHQSSKSYKNAFANHQSKNETHIQIWRDALKTAAKISGLVSSNKDDAKLIKEIVHHVLKKLVKSAMNSKGLVGIDEKIAILESWIKEEPKDTRIIGIWGMGGLGKTTLAEQVFNKLRCDYGGSYFLANETDQSSKRELISLKEEIFSQLLGYGVKIDTPNSMPENIVRGIGRLKIFVVLDDVSDPDHMKKLLGNPKNFGLGSRIIITTRNEQVLKTNQADEIYQLTKLSFDEALELFNLNAFNKSDNQNEYHQLSERVVHYAQGIPLVLEVLAGHLRGNKKEVWESELGKLDKMPHKKVYDVMIRNYRDLEPKQKQIFLDLACFFLRSHHEINVSDLKCLLKDDEGDNSVVSDLERLKNEALITVSEDNFVSMHDLLQEMALEIALRESVEGQESLRWLWDPNDIYEAFKNDKVIEAIRSLRIPLKEMKENDFIPKIFSRMSRLQFLHVSLGEHHIHTLAEELQFLSSELRVLDFEFYPLRFLPEHFSVEKLVILSLKYGNMEKLWDDVKNLVNLRKLDLSESVMLRELPDLSKARNLEVLLLRGCRRVESVHQSIFSLPKLEKLDLSECSFLTKLATDSHLCKLNYLNLDSCEHLTEFLVISENMKELRLGWTKVKTLPLFFEHQSKLELLNLHGSAIEKLPSSISNITKLLHVDLGDCMKLKSLPELPQSLETLEVGSCSELLPKLPQSLKTLYVRCCYALQTLPKLPASIETLDVTSCSALLTLPELPQSLKTLCVSYCESLQTLPEFPPSLETLDVSSCSALSTLPELPPSLETLELGSCSALLPKFPQSLKTLYVICCFALQTLPKLPASIETLHVRSCYALLTLPELPQCLKTLCVSYCESLQTLPEFPPSLETLEVSGCSALSTVPELPPSLETLEFGSCSVLLPKLPQSLKTLRVGKSESLQTLPELYLKTLCVGEIESLQTLPELPQSLKILYVWEFKSLQTLPELSPSIETLDVRYCSALPTLPELPKSLKTLYVSDCESLIALPELPPSLETLDVSRCSAAITLPELPQSLKKLNTGEGECPV